MSPFTVGSRDASRNGNQSVLTGPKKACFLQLTVCLVCYTRWKHVVMKSFKAPLSSALMTFCLLFFFFFPFLVVNLKTFSSLDPVNSKPSAIKHRHPVHSKYIFRFGEASSTTVCLTYQKSHSSSYIVKNTSWSSVGHKFNVRYCA